jgi:hypothetical protein
MAVFSIRIIKANNLCTDKNIKYMMIFHRTILLLSVYLYSQYTVKCIPLLNLVFNDIFDFPLTGKILKSFFSYLFLELADNILNMYELENDKNDFTVEDDICKISYSNEKLTITFIILTFVICNTYIDELKSIYMNK